jgi:signal transduction histidine kinase/DNA-binding NarL/FixJ family response regulator/predicted RNA-binding protein with RPS1 domain
MVELSLRRAMADPWDKWVPTLRVGQVVRGTVASVRDAEAFIEIKPGLRALLRLDDIAPWRIDKAGDILWVDDHVEVVITRLDHSHRRLQVSLRQRLEQIASTRSSGGRPKPVEPRVELSTAIAPLPDEARTIRRVLIVEDDDALRQPLADMLRRVGREVDDAADPERGATMGVEQRYDAVFMDVHFSTTMSGQEAGQFIRNAHPSTLLVFMTGFPLTEEELDGLLEVGPVEILRKPFAGEELAELLTELERGTLSPLTKQNDGRSAKTQPARVKRSTSDEYVHLTTELQTLRREVNADAAAVFCMDLQTHEVACLATDGASHDLWRRGRDWLAKSPVGDVIVGGELIEDKDVKGSRINKYANLLILIDFDTCIGLPLSLGEQPLEHALFLFWGLGREWPDAALQQVRRAASRLKTALERARIQQRIVEVGQLSLAGEMSAVLAHEINGKLSGMDMQLENLSVAIQKPTPDGLADVQQKLAALRSDMRDILQRAKDFQALMKSSEPGQIDINPLVSRLTQNLQPLALNRYKAALVPLLGENLPLCRGDAAQLDHVCNNLLLNALEWVRRKPATGGTVWLRTGLSDDRRRVWIRVQDDGFGIHRRDLPRLFDFGFTRRGSEGTGLGLYVARLFMERMGGKIGVEESVMLIGTTFRVDLPVAESEADSHA